MKSNGLIAILLAMLMLPGVANGASPPKAMFVSHATEGYSDGWTSYGKRVLVDALVYPSGQSTLQIIIWDFTNGREIGASGVVPSSMFKVMGNSLVINIPDLRQLGPGFAIWDGPYGDFPEPLAINCTMTQTPELTNRVVSQITELLPDGTTAKYVGNYTQTSMHIEGNVLGYWLPLSDAYYGYDWMRRGNYRFNGYFWGP